MLTALALADVSYEAWKDDVDNALFQYAGSSLDDVAVTETELRELFDDGWIPVSAAAQLPRVHGAQDPAIAFLLAN